MMIIIINNSSFTSCVFLCDAFKRNSVGENTVWICLCFLHRSHGRPVQLLQSKDEAQLPDDIRADIQRHSETRGGKMSA